jgi:hypothetical protein
MAIIEINTDKELSKLVDKILNKEKLCEKFKFEPYALRNLFLKKLGINIKKFEEKYYYYDNNTKLHISESEWKYVLVSTIGLVAHNDFESEKDRIFFAYESQYEVVVTLIDKALELKEKPDTYDVDSYNYEYLMRMTTGIFHNIIFYLELFAKTYLSINGIRYKNIHNLDLLFKDVKKVMFKKKHNNTIFHAMIFSECEPLIRYLKMVSDDFKEQYIKYNETEDVSILIDYIDNMKKLITLGSDFMCQFYYDLDDCYQLKQGLYEKLLKKAKNKAEKERIKGYYKFLINEEKEEYSSIC